MTQNRSSAVMQQRTEPHDSLDGRIEADRQQRRIECLLAALRAIAVYGDDKKPSDSISEYDAKLNGDRVDNWHAGHEEGIETGRWLAGCEAQEALDEWERTR